MPESFYEDAIASGWDESMRSTYAPWSGREEDGNLTVTSGEQMVKCFTTDQMLEHLDEDRTWGLFVPDHVYDRLERDRSENDQVIQRYFDEHGLRRPATNHWEPHGIYPEFTQWSTHHEALGQLAAMLVIAILVCRTSHRFGALSRVDSGLQRTPSSRACGRCWARLKRPIRIKTLISA